MTTSTTTSTDRSDPVDQFDSSVEVDLNSRSARRSRRPVPAPVVLGVAFACGSVPFSGLAARLLTGVDLRRRGSGTVSGTGLYEVAGFRALAVAGSLDVAKGAIGPLLAGRDRPRLAVASVAACLVGHNWSPLLGGAGGRGISPALGATLVMAPEGTVVIGSGLGLGRLVHQSAIGTLVSLVALFPILAKRRGRNGLLIASAIVGPMVAKRLAGNRSANGSHRLSVLAARLLFDRDRWSKN